MLRKFIKKYKLVVAFLLIVLFLMPFTIYKPAETEKIAIATSLGIDVDKEKNIEITLNILVPSGGGGANGGSIGTVKTVTGKATNITGAIAKISLELGKIVGLAHCDAVVISENALDEDIINKLDYFVRTNNLTSNAVVIITDKEAKKVIESSAQEKTDLALSLSNIIAFNKEFLFSSKSNIEIFYEQYFSQSGISVLPVLTVAPQDESIKGSESSASTSGESSEIGTSKNSESEDSSGGLNSAVGGENNFSGESSGSGSGSESGSGSGSESGSGSGSESGSGSGSESGGGSGSESGGGSGSDSGGGSEGSGQSSGSESGGSGNGSQEKGTQNGAEQSSGGGGDSSASGQGKSVLKNEGKAVIVKKGKIVHKLTDKEVAALNLISKTTTKGNIAAKNVSNNEFKNANVNFEIFDKQVRNSGYFLDETPIFNIDLNLILQLKEVEMDNYSLQSLDATKTHLDSNVKKAVELSVHDVLAETISTAKKNQTDIFGVYDYFYKFHHEKWDNYIKSLPDKDDFLNKVVFTISLYQHGKL